MLDKLKSEKKDLQDHLDAHTWLVQGAMGSAERVTMERQYARRRRQLEEIQGAIKSLESGEDKYGRCVRCGEMIDPDRLAILPWATMCVECKLKGDNGEVYNHARRGYSKEVSRGSL